MADNVRGGSTDSALPNIATDDVGGVHYQRVKLDVGGDGSSTPVTAAAPLPVVQTGTPGLPTGAATAALQTSTETLVGAVGESAPASDTASSGLNGRLQRIAQRLTSLIALLPSSIGQKAKAGSLSVVLASDSDPLDVTGSITASGTVGLAAGTNNIGDVDIASAIPAGTNNIGDVDVLTLPADPLGANADAVVAAGAAGSISAKLRRLTQGVEDLKTTIVLAAGSAAIGKLSANSGVDIGDVDVTSLPVVNPVVRISQTPTVTAGAYTANDAMGGLLTFANAARVSGGGGTIGSVTVVDKSAQRPNLELVLFDQTFTETTDNAAFDPSDADLANVIGVVAINSWSNFADNAVATVSSVNLPYDLTGTSLFGQLVTRSAPTLVGTSDIIVIVQVIQA